jgi:hypothetical protein
MTFCVQIEATSEEEAKEKAFEPANFLVKVEGKSVELCEFEMHEKIVKGNVFYGVQNQVEVVEII